MNIPLFSVLSHAGWFAKTLFAIMVIESLVSWSIIFHRFMVLRAAQDQNKKFKSKFDTMNSLSDIETTSGALLTSPCATLVKTAFSELKRIVADTQGLTGVKEWGFYLQSQFDMVNEKLDSTVSVLTAKLDKGLFLLAIVSSSAPFLGLLGTVWGIMDSFFQIGNQGSASLPVVAPGIAEALIMTAVGLIVAIPAVFFYNIYMHRVSRIEDELDEFKDHLLGRVRREIFAVIYKEPRTNAKPASAPTSHA